jgi:hypothetical protein
MENNCNLRSQTNSIMAFGFSSINLRDNQYVKKSYMVQDIPGNYLHCFQY